MSRPDDQLEIDWDDSAIPWPLASGGMVSQVQTVFLKGSFTLEGIFSGGDSTGYGAPGDTETVVGSGILVGTTHGRLPFPCTHPYAAAGMPVWAPELCERLREFDVLFAVGMDVVRLYVYYEPPRALPGNTTSTLVPRP